MVHRNRTTAMFWQRWFVAANSRKLAQAGRVIHTARCPQEGPSELPRRAAFVGETALRGGPGCAALLKAALPYANHASTSANATYPQDHRIPCTRAGIHGSTRTG